MDTSQRILQLGTSGWEEVSCATIILKEHEIAWEAGGAVGLGQMLKDTEATEIRGYCVTSTQVLSVEDQQLFPEGAETPLHPPAKDCTASKTSTTVAESIQSIWHR